MVTWGSSIVGNLHIHSIEIKPTSPVQHQKIETTGLGLKSFRPILPGTLSTHTSQHSTGSPAKATQRFSI